MTEIIKTDGTRQPVQPANGSDFTLEEMQAIVGGYIELVELDGSTTMVVQRGRQNLSLCPSILKRAGYSVLITRRRKTSSLGTYLCAITIKSDKIMDKEKAKALSKTLACYKELQENNSVNLIEFHTADGQKHGIGNPEAIKLLLSVAVIELERQLRTAQFGDIPESLENSREYKAAKQLEYAMNDLGFKSERFAQALPYFHKTLEQTFFRTVKASITAMAGRDSRCIDDRNRASYEMCQMLASMLEDTRLPFI